MLKNSVMTKATERCDKIIRVSYYCLIYFLPISIALVESFFGVILLTFFVKRSIVFYCRLHDKVNRNESGSLADKVTLFFKSFMPVENYLRWHIGVFIFFGFISILISKFPLLSIQGFVFKLLEWTFLYFIFIESIKTRGHLNIFLASFLASAMLVGMSGFIQKFTKVDFILGHPVTDGRITSSFKHANDFGAYLIVASLVVLSIFLFNKKQLRHDEKRNLNYAILLRIFFLAFSLLLIVCLGLTYSRGAWIAFFVGLVFLGFLRKKIFLTVLVIITIFVCTFFPRLERARNVSFLEDNVALEKAESRSRLLADGSEQNSLWISRNISEAVKHFTVSSRGIFWKHAVELIERFPFGIGLNTYSKVSREYIYWWNGYPHNCYLQLIAEMGFMGFLAFSWMIAVLFWRSIRSIHHVTDSYLKSILIGTIAGLLGFLVHSAVDTNLYSVQLGNLLWIFMGVAVAVQNINNMHTDQFPHA